MLNIRHEVSYYMSACERLISLAMMPDHEKLTVDECRVVEYYAGELSKIVQSETDDDDASMQLDMLSMLSPVGTSSVTPADMGISQ
jgi:hypothetical protein